MAIDANSGNLHVQLNKGRWSAAKWLVERAPVAWQNDSGGRIPVEVTYALSENGAIHFDLVGYDPALPLVIDLLALIQ